MRYLKKFNEGVDIVSEITKLTNDSLAYLMDDGCRLLIEPLGGGRIHIMLEIDNRHWVDIKDYLIPLIPYMSTTFHIGKGIGGDNKNDKIGIMYKDAIEDEYFTNFTTVEEFLEGEFDFIEECDGEDYIDQIFFNVLKDSFWKHL